MKKHLFQGFLSLCVLGCLGWLVLRAHNYQWQQVWQYRIVFARGWAFTCLLSFFSLITSTLIGALLALLRRSPYYFLRSLAICYIETIRGTPLLVQLLINFYVIASALHFNNRIAVGVITLSIFSGAYIAEIIRSGIESIRGSLIDSARSLGMNRYQIYRFVIFPLVLRQILPPLAGQSASIIKDSSLLSILGISEMTFSAQKISSATFSTLESYIPLGITYLMLTLPISLLSKKIERDFSYES